MLDGERSVVVTGEEHHQDVLWCYQPERGRSRRVVIELVPIGPRLEARLDGQRVGELTALMSQRYGQTVDSVLRRGGRPGCIGRVVLGKRGVEVELRLPAVNAAGGPPTEQLPVIRPIAAAVPAAFAPGAALSATAAFPPARPPPAPPLPAPRRNGLPTRPRPCRNRLPTRRRPRRNRLPTRRRPRRNRLPTRRRPRRNGLPTRRRSRRNGLPTRRRPRRNGIPTRPRPCRSPHVTRPGAVAAHARPAGAGPSTAEPQAAVGGRRHRGAAGPDRRSGGRVARRHADRRHQRGHVLRRPGPRFPDHGRRPDPAPPPLTRPPVTRPWPPPGSRPSTPRRTNPPPSGRDPRWSDPSPWHPPGNPPRRRRRRIPPLPSITGAARRRRPRARHRCGGATPATAADSTPTATAWPARSASEGPDQAALSGGAVRA